MKIAALEDFLQNPNLASSQQLDVLEKFLLYAKLVQDPLNVFRYMEEKSICIYFSHFWFAKSQYLAQIGDYRNAFLCLKEAQQRESIQEDNQSSKILNTKLKAQLYRDQISNEMIKYPPNKRRTVSDFTLITSKYEDLPGSQEYKTQQMLNLLETKFPILRIEKEKTFLQKNSEKPKSWLCQNYEKQQRKVQQIINQTFKSHLDDKDKKSDPPLQYQDRLFKSLNTPFKRRDPMRLTKTIDSVEMQKRRKRSGSKSNSKKNKYLISSSEKLIQRTDEDDQNVEDRNEICINTMPVGKSFKQMKKHVRFEKVQNSFKIEKPRNDGSITKEDDKFQLSRKSHVQLKGILRNKSGERNRQKSPDFSQITEMKLKKTEQNQI